jgi:hypothetical protein
MASVRTHLLLFMPISDADCTRIDGVKMTVATLHYIYRLPYG